VKERGLLYDVEPQNRNNGNQISAVDVKEQDVVYCWSVESKTAESLERPVRDEARRLGFKGTIIIADTNKVCRPFSGKRSRILPFFKEAGTFNPVVQQRPLATVQNRHSDFPLDVFLTVIII